MKKRPCLFAMTGSLFYCLTEEYQAEKTERDQEDNAPMVVPIISYTTKHSDDRRKQSLSLQNN